MPVKTPRMPQPSLHVEWTPACVRAVDVRSGETAEAATLADLGPILAGHRSALVGVGRRAVFCKAVPLPRASGEDLRRILGVQMAQLFPLPPDQLSFDFVQTAEQTPEGCLTVVAAMRSEDLRRLQADLKQADLAAARILPVALASPAVAASLGLGDALVVEGGPGGLALDVVQHGALVFSRLVPEGSDPDAEARRTLAAAKAWPLPLVTVGERTLPDAQPGFGTALSRLHEAPPFCFRLAEDRAWDLKRRAGERTRLAALLMLSALLLVGLTWADRQDARAAQTRRQGALARRIAVLESIRSTEAASAEQVMAVQDVLDRAFAPAQPLSDIVSVAGDSLSRGAWLSGLSVERGKPLQIRGAARTAQDVSGLVQALGRSPRFRDVRLVFANSVTVGKTRVVEFDVSAVCVGNLPLAEPDKGDTAAGRAPSPPAGAEGGVGE